MLPDISRPLLFSFTNPTRPARGTAWRLPCCQHVDENITFIRAHYITTDISFANSFQCSFPPSCPGKINMSFIGMWEKTNPKLISNKKRKKESRVESGIVCLLSTYHVFLAGLSIQETVLGVFLICLKHNLLPTWNNPRVTILQQSYKTYSSALQIRSSY